MRETHRNTLKQTDIEAYFVPCSHNIAARQLARHFIRQPPCVQSLAKLTLDGRAHCEHNNNTKVSKGMGVALKGCATLFTGQAHRS